MQKYKKSGAGEGAQGAGHLSLWRFTSLPWVGHGNILHAFPVSRLIKNFCAAGSIEPARDNDRKVVQDAPAAVRHPQKEAEG